MKDWRTPKNKCLACPAELDAVSSPFGKKKPRPSDVTVCLRCGHLMGFKSDMTVRELTSDEMIELAGNKQILAIQTARGHVLLDKRKVL